MIHYCMDKQIDYDKLIVLFNQVGWHDKTKDIDRLKAMVEHSQIVVTAWDNEEMVGFARCITDHVFNGQINNVVVDENYRGQGIGKALVEKILNTNRQVTYILRGDPENEGFYKSLGFVDSDYCLVFKRRE